MGFRFYKRVKIAPGIRLNVSKSGPSLTFGGKGMHYTVGHGRRRTTVGLPGTGLSYTTTRSTKRGRATPSRPGTYLPSVTAMPRPDPTLDGWRESQLSQIAQRLASVQIAGSELAAPPSSMTATQVAESVTRLLGDLRMLRSRLDALGGPRQDETASNLRQALDEQIRVAEDLQSRSTTEIAGVADTAPSNVRTSPGDATSDEAHMPTLAPSARSDARYGGEGVSPSAAGAAVHATQQAVSAPGTVEVSKSEASEWHWTEDRGWRKTGFILLLSGLVLMVTPLWALSLICNFAAATILIICGVRGVKRKHRWQKQNSGSA